MKTKYYILKTATSPHYYVWKQCHSKATFIRLTVNRERFGTYNSVYLVTKSVYKLSKLLNLLYFTLIYVGRVK
ncbi:Uncharacterized protein APZ42_033212 [Daphnia magna]|uniref:Uncharacterized protein n=1 Tax=Daphnia magna TaxID=35525 RepID=A0A164LAK3_9CRUS|nr:Uncharacterized protein APZ42_033212 [Daphnia magna]